MPKFFIKTKQIKNNRIIITGEDVNHIKNVLRKEIGDNLEICNKETSRNYLAKIDRIESKLIDCTIIKKLETNAESNVYIDVLQGIPKLNKMELIIQKSIELGASEITPITMKRCVVKIEEKDKTKKLTRWNKIAEVASKQSGRDIIPKIVNITTINEICNKTNNYDLILVAYEKEKEKTLKYELKKLKERKKNNYKIAIVIGPEGGIDQSEIELLQQNGAKVVTLGNRILRTETVALNIISIINYELEL